MDCYHCGQEGHRRSECPSRMPAPAATWPSAVAESQKTPQPPPFSSLPRRAPEEIADPGPWAEQIRHDMGWSSEQAEAWRLERARRQVAESRWQRLAFLDQK